MIQLKSLIKEEVLNENMVSVLKPPIKKTNLQYTDTSIYNIRIYQSTRSIN